MHLRGIGNQSMKDELSVLRRHECCQANVGQSRRLSEVPFRFLRTEVVDARKHLGAWALGVSFVRKRDHRAVLVGILYIYFGSNVGHRRFESRTMPPAMSAAIVAMLEDARPSLAVALLHRMQTKPPFLGTIMNRIMNQIQIENRTKTRLYRRPVCFD